ncbi:DUF4132 domain-containing protein [Streptacidiphilus sp. N1-12]|uniref:DUF4132 domain-containing protein n=2 Tax=Streptacidiphilus alkalitolerans TaxID=3342712 RepID=A0ABV6WKX1_9ACTN
MNTVMDEDTFTLPSSWHRQLHPRRGGVARKVTPRGDEALRGCEQLLTENDLVVTHALANAASDTALVEAARAHRDGTPNPLGAAVVALAAQGERYEPFADFWVTRYGLPFAACAVAELFELHIDLMGSSTSVKRLAEGQRSATINRRRPVADRMRALIAATDEESYRATVTALGAHRDGIRRRVVVAYLLPSETEWVTEACAQPGPHGQLDDIMTLMLLSSVSTPEQRSLITWPLRLGWGDWSLATFATLAEGLGTDAAPVIGQALDTTYLSGDYLRTVSSVLAEIPGDEAFGLLLARIQDRHVRAALSVSAKRQPRRALRLLAAAAGAPSVETAKPARELLLHVMAHRELAEAALTELAPELAAAVAPLLVQSARIAEAPVEALPPLLVSPPWTRRRKAAKPRVRTGLTPRQEQPQVAWAVGEQQDWAVDRSWHMHQSPRPDWDTQIEAVRAGRLSWYLAVQFFVDGPAERVRPLLADWDPGESWDAVNILRPIVAKHGVLALPPVLRAAVRNPASAGVLLLPFLDLDTARLMAEWLVRLKSAGQTARGWFARHGLPAVALLVPDAVGPAGADRRRAEAALRLAAGRHGAEAVRAVAAEYGAEAGGIVGELLSADPLEAVLPARMPVVGEWAEPALLPQITLAKGGALPEESVRHVFTVLALSKPGDRYAGLDVVLESCDRESLAEFAWGLFEGWRKAAMPPKDSWALQALAWFGDDSTVRRLTPVLRAWPGEGMHQRATEGLDVLAAIGSDVALMHLHGIAQRVPFKALKTRAQEKIAEIAETLGLTGDQLADRLVPDLGLNADGSTVINYGPRSFTVGFDEQLRPYVLDQDGKRRKDLPVPGAKDDAERAPAERKRFAALKKDVRTIATDQVRRLEAAMVTQRAWSAAEFDELFVQHPLVWHLVRRLVWLADHNGTVQSFRVAEDRSCADAEDNALTLPQDATVRLAHPLLLDGGTLAAWAELFADYEILQPFPQLGRAVHTLTEEEAETGRLSRFEGVTVPVGKVLRLQQRGWERGQPQDAGVECWISRQVAEDRFLVIDLDPGIPVGAVADLGDQTLAAVGLAAQPDSYWRGRNDTLSLRPLSPVLASELIADLTELVAK